MKTKYILPLIILGFASASCSDFLDREPTSSVSDKDAFSSVASAETVLNGAYSLMSNSLYHTLSIIAIDMMGEDITASNGNFGYPHYYRNIYSYSYAQTPFAEPWWYGYALKCWEYAYKSIDNCNSILYNAESIVPDGAKKKDIIAQARGLRGYHYLLLVQLYAKAYNLDKNSPGIVLREVPADANDEGVARSSVADAYAFIIKDLQYAVENCTNTDKGMMTSRGAALLLARAYLTMNDMPNAIKYADIAASNKFDGSNLMSKDQWRSGFKSSNDEWLWYVDFTAAKSNIYASIPSFYYLCDSVKGYPYGSDVPLDVVKKDGINYLSGYSTSRFTAAFRNMFEDKDCRKLFPVRMFVNDGYVSSKFGHRSQLGDASFVMARIAEAYLIKAEALALTDPAMAEGILNKLQVSRGATPTSGDLLNNIYLERRKELYGEGFRMFDIKRLRQPLKRSGNPEHWEPLDLPADSPRFMFPIPYDEIVVNKKLSQADQNEYWR